VLQQVIVLLIVLACAGWLGVQVYRFFRPKPGGKMCGAGCCDGEEKKPAAAASEGNGGGHVMMISSDDLRARIKARKG
jgi:hypothetical protein